MESGVTMTNSAITYSRASDVVSCDLESGGALLDLNSSVYFRLNDTGKFIWEKLGEGPKSALQLATTVSEDFATTADECLPDIVAVMAELEKSNLVTAEK